jgi:hypothetical protein
MQESYNIPKRSAGKKKVDVGNKDLYEFYKSQLKPVESIAGGETLGSYDIKAKLYGEVLRELNSRIFDLIILENFEFKLPYSLGKLSMVQKKVKIKLDENGELKTKNLAVNYKATNELWRNDEEARKNKTLIFHTNEHSDGNRMSYMWSKKGAKCQGLESYYFLACRTIKRKPSKFLSDPDLKLMFYERPLTDRQKYLKMIHNA